ncbi:MAG TPA: carotenoid oxygenase family protein [Polyangiaceae bacterium]
MSGGPTVVPFHLAGAYAPVLEERTLRDLEVAGAIPSELCGTFVRNGPNPRTAASPAWFAGEGMLHGIRIEGGSARWYRNRWMKGVHGPNTSVVRHAGRILALVESALPVEVDGLLETVGRFDFGGDLPVSMIAHPKTCPATGELLFLSYGRELPQLTYYRADASGRIVHRAPIRVPAVTYMHDFGITERHVVFWDLPVLLGEWRSPVPFRWTDDYRPRIGVLRRDGHDDDIVWFDVEPSFISHTVNAFEDGDLVVLDVVRAPRLMKACALYRYIFDLRTGTVTEDVVVPRFVDLPRVHPASEGRPYGQGYGVELSDWETGGWQRAVARQYDMATGVSRAHDFGPSRMPGELVVAPRPGASAEDEAWAMTFVYDRVRDASDLVILDARRFEEPPVATVRLPCRVPIGLHGAWCPDRPSVNDGSAANLAT